MFEIRHRAPGRNTDCDIFATYSPAILWIARRFQIPLPTARLIAEAAFPGGSR